MDKENRTPEVTEPTDEEFLEKEPYKPRPKWQVALAWVGLGLFLFILVMYYGLMFKG